MRFTLFLLGVLFTKCKFNLFKIRDTFKKKKRICHLFAIFLISTFLPVKTFSHQAESQHIPADCLLHKAHPVDVFSTYRRLPFCFFSMCLRGACVLCPLTHLLISPLNRMDALVRTSLEPIRCIDRDTACPSLSLIQNRAALYSVYADFAFSLHRTQLKPSSQSSLSPFISLPCVYMLSHHMYCYHSVPSQDAADLLYSR